MASSQPVPWVNLSKYKISLNSVEISLLKNFIRDKIRFDLTPRKID